ncbi:autophagy-related protein 13-domain-containing protein [Mycena rebaudengoi]|nr:autophagy-related protein 13-domain-containing protein [Mycena rebaudengoi]
MAAGDSAKSDQITFHIYTKLFHVLYAARAAESNPATARVDKWFNLETPLATAPPAELDAYRALSSAPPPPPPLAPALALQILLAVPPAGGGLALVHAVSRTRVEPEPRWVLLEEWVLRFASSPSSSASSASSSASSTSSTDNGGRDEVLLPTIYKNAIPLFRALFALLRILPAWRVVRKLAGRGARAGDGRRDGDGDGGKRRGGRACASLCGCGLTTTAAQGGE